MDTIVYLFVFRHNAITINSYEWNNINIDECCEFLEYNFDK